MSDLAHRIQTLLREGLSQREVAKRVGCSKMTIHRHRVPGLPSAHSNRPQLTDFPVHPDIEATKLELLAAFVTGRDTGPLRQRLVGLLELHHPRDQRDPAQLERCA